MSDLDKPILYRRKLINYDKAIVNYHNFDYVSRRFPFYRSLPGFDKVIEKIIEDNIELSPLQQLENRINNNN